MTYLVTSYPPAKDGQLKLIECHEYHEPTADYDGLRPIGALASAIKGAEASVLAGHTSVRVWKLHGSPELIQVVKWSQDAHD